MKGPDDSPNDELFEISPLLDRSGDRTNEM